MEYRMALQKRPVKAGKPIQETTSPIKDKPGKPIIGKPSRPKDPIKKLPRLPGTNPQLDQIKKQIEERNKKDGQYVDSLYNTYPM